MPGRVTPLVTDFTYHIFNRGIDRRPTFISKREYLRAIQTMRYYQFAKPPIRLSKFLMLEQKRQDDLISYLSEKPKLVEIITYCLMPNHFHFILKQSTDNGIPKFLSNFQNSYTRYFNTKNKRDGSLFLDQFKAVLIETDEQLLHLSRYVHLNPYTSAVVKSLNSLLFYPYSSLIEYLGQTPENFCYSDQILSSFKNTESYKSFIVDQADYQKELHLIQYLQLDS